MQEVAPIVSVLSDRRIGKADWEWESGDELSAQFPDRAPFSTDSIASSPSVQTHQSMATEAPVASTSAIVGGKAVPQQLVYCAGEQP